MLNSNISLNKFNYNLELIRLYFLVDDLLNYIPKSTVTLLINRNILIKLITFQINFQIFFFQFNCFISVLRKKDLLT